MLLFVTLFVYKTGMNAGGFSGPQCSECLMNCIFGDTTPTGESFPASVGRACQNFCATQGCNGRPCPDCSVSRR